MTTIRYYNTPRHFSIALRGHAEYAESGKDIVCAGISVLTSELLLAAKKEHQAGNIRHFRYHMRSADVSVSFDYADAKALFFTVELILECLQLLAEQYHENIRICRQQEKSNIMSKQTTL